MVFRTARYLDGDTGGHHLHWLDLRFSQTACRRAESRPPGDAQGDHGGQKADAEKLADLLRVNLLPGCTMMPEELRELRRILRYRNLVVRTATQMKNRISGLLMEVGVSYNKRRLHRRSNVSARPCRLENRPELRPGNAPPAVPRWLQRRRRPARQRKTAPSVPARGRRRTHREKFPQPMFNT